MIAILTKIVVVWWRKVDVKSKCILGFRAWGSDDCIWKDETEKDVDYFSYFNFFIWPVGGMIKDSLRFVVIRSGRYERDKRHKECSSVHRELRVLGTIKVIDCFIRVGMYTSGNERKPSKRCGLFWDVF